jgi:hypothetical protein
MVLGTMGLKMFSLKASFSTKKDFRGRSIQIAIPELDRYAREWGVSKDLLMTQ